MSANLLGFVLGTEGMAYFAGMLFGSWEGASLLCSQFRCITVSINSTGLRFLSLALPSLFVIVQFMFEYR